MVFLQHFPPMGVYETLFQFSDASGKYMGDPGTHPWVQGFPLTTQLPDGPPLPDCIRFHASDLKYPQATGNVALREAIANYYNHFYSAEISPDHVAVFAGGRPAIYATLAFALEKTTIAVEETEYPPYYDAIKLLQRNMRVIPSNAQNAFRPGLEDYPIEPVPGDRQVLLLTSNPCNPTGVAKTEAELKDLVERYRHPSRGAIFDEAYEFFSESGPQSAMQMIGDIDQSNFFVVGAATKGLQVPGLRIGWVVAARQHIAIFRNFSSIAMGGVSRPSQIAVTEMLNLQRVQKARQAIGKFYNAQRVRYGAGLRSLGFELFTGTGGFYHWGRLPNGLTARQFNQRLFKRLAAVLPGPVCDMHHRPEASNPLANFVRFSFGPLPAESYEDDMRILEACLR
jgi:aspartate/methionine/tyrosine aminotransferase